MLRNEGPGVAIDPFISLMVHRIPGEHCGLTFEPTDPKNWTGYFSFGRHISVIARPEVRVPPQAHIQPLVLSIMIAPPFTQGVKVEGVVGCGNGSPFPIVLENDRESVASLYDDFIRREKSGILTDDEKYQFIRDLLRISSDQPPFA